MIILCSTVVQSGSGRLPLAAFHLNIHKCVYVNSKLSVATKLIIGCKRTGAIHEFQTFFRSSVQPNAFLYKERTFWETAIYVYICTS